MNDDAPSFNFILLTGAKRVVYYESCASLKILDRIIGNSAGYIFSTLKSEDLIWINDYPLELIASFSDNEMCGMDLIAIKGNVSKSEAEEMKEQLTNMYKMLRSEEGDYDPIATSIEKYIAELLERNIFMVGFCSC